MTDHWLVRTSQNMIAGPYTKDQVRRLILDRQLKMQDEVCQANSYWIFLHERDEVSQTLGDDAAQALIPQNEDATQTQTQTDKMEPRPSTAPGNPADSPQGPELPKRPMAPLSAIIGDGTPQRQVETVSFWKGFSWILLLLIGVLVLAMLKVLSKN